MTFNAEHLTQAFELMALGMGGVFPSIRILYAVSAILLKAFPPGKEADPWKISFSNDYGSIAIKARQDWEWLMDQANLGKTDRLIIQLRFTITSGEPAATGFFRPQHFKMFSGL